MMSHAGLGYDIDNIRIKLLKLFVTNGVSHWVSQMEMGMNDRVR